MLPGSWPSPEPNLTRSAASSLRSSPAPAYESASSATSPPDAIVAIGDGHWLRVPLGKLRNDRYVPLHPDLVELLTAWVTDHHDQIRRYHRLLAAPEGPLNRHRVARILERMARTAGIGHVTPHQLRHTLATQAINRGMRLEAIAALLGHRSLEMTLIYARIADRVVADEYAAVSEQIDALYGQPLPATEPQQMARLRLEAHARLLGNGLCTRPAQLDCRMETVCETCTYFHTGPDFVPVLLRQRDHARDRDQTGLPSSTSSSNRSRRTPLDADHPYNTEYAPSSDAHVTAL
jgi:integrase/recombinase XerD